jgi:hypothetical protein
MVTMPKKVVPRQVDAYIRGGGGSTPLPNWEKPAQIDRHFIRETEAAWRVVCSCGEERMFMGCDITHVAAEVDYWHQTHKKFIFIKQGMKYHFRGNIPAMQNEETGEDLHKKGK